MIWVAPGLLRVTRAFSARENIFGDEASGVFVARKAFVMAK